MKIFPTSTLLELIYTNLRQTFKTQHICILITLDYSWPGTFNKKDLHIQILLNPQLNPDNQAFSQERLFVNPNKANK